MLSPRLGSPGPALHQCGHPTGDLPSFYACPACRASALQHRGQGRGFVVAVVIGVVVCAAGLGACCV